MQNETLGATLSDILAQGNQLSLRAMLTDVALAAFAFLLERF